MFGTLQKLNTFWVDIFWLRLENDVQLAIENCVGRARNESRYRHKRQLKLFVASGFVSFVAVDNNRRVSKRRQVRQYIAVITSRCAMVTRAIATSLTSLAHTMNLFFDYCIVSFAVPVCLLYNGELKFKGKLSHFFAAAMALGSR